MKKFAMVFALFAACNSVHAAGWQPSPGHAQVPIWPGRIPDAVPITQAESFGMTTDSLVAGKPWLWVTNVAQPTLTVYSPTTNNTGAAVVVFPGGGYQVLAMDLEGTEICDWLVSRGITCVLSKYRVPHSGPYYDEKLGRVHPPHSTALEDAQRTISLVRYHAAEWHIDPDMIGVIGFSAGGHLVARTSMSFAQRSYAPVDAADKSSCRPDFAIGIYPGHIHNEHLSEKQNTTLSAEPDIRVPKDAPPTFLVMAEDDHVDGVEQALSYYVALKNAGVPTEMHLYAQGGHAFGLRPGKLPISQWPRLVEAWLHTIGVLAN